MQNYKSFGSPKEIPQKAFRKKSCVKILKNRLKCHLKIFLINGNSAHTQKRIVSAFIKTLKIKYLPSSAAKSFNLRIPCISNTEPLGSEISSAIKCFTSLPKLAVGTMAETLHTWLKDVFRNHSIQTDIWLYLKRTVKVMGQREASHHFL